MIKRSERFGLILLALMTIAIICAAPASAAPTTKIFERTLPLRAGGALSLTNVNGSVQIEGWDKEEVEIRAVKTALNDPQDIERVTIDAESDGDSAAINTIYPQGNGVAVTVDYRIHVPERVLLDGIETVNGDMHVAGITGAGELASVNGAVEVVEQHRAIQREDHEWRCPAGIEGPGEGRANATRNRERLSHSVAAGRCRSRVERCQPKWGFSFRFSAALAGGIQPERVSRGTGERRR
ncbi:MAG TPA: hypothetical protein VGR72_08170 [Candidatus Acidoferrales bacterium]|nr:hypothetical protein [Candidatus Acidoferrales bacterium]